MFKISLFVLSLVFISPNLFAGDETSETEAAGTGITEEKVTGHEKRKNRREDRRGHRKDRRKARHENREERRDDRKENREERRERRDK